MKPTLKYLIFVLLLSGWTFAGNVWSITDVYTPPMTANNDSLSNEIQLSTLLDILRIVYENDMFAMPSDANDIDELQTSTDARDQFVSAILEMIRVTQNDELSDSEGAEASAMLMMEMDSGEDLSGPLESCILEPRTYRIQSLPLQIVGHVVIPAGTTLIAPYDPNNSIIEVVPGGLLETGKAVAGTVWTDPNILPPVKIESADPNFIYTHNLIGIYVQRGADPRTQIDNVTIKNCTIGIIIDEKLETPVENIIMYGCYDGIWVCAPALIRNCLLWQNGSVYAGVYDYIGTGIYVWMNWEGDANVEIEQVTLYGGDVPLYIEGGSQDPNNNEPNHVVPNVDVINTAITAGQFYGIYQSEGQADIDVRYCGFGGNRNLTNISSPLVNCLDIQKAPFYNREQNWEQLYVRPWSLLIDNGYGITTDGTGVNPDLPDIGKTDIGYHFAIGKNGFFGVPANPADFNRDGVVDMSDMELMNQCMGATTDPNIVSLDRNYDSRINLPDMGLFAADWGYCSDPNFCTNNDPNCRRSDLNGDNWVDIGDLSILAEHWLEPVFDEYRLCSLCNLAPANDPNLSESIDDDDMDVFMADWGAALPRPECDVAFNDANYLPIEPNQLSGDITVIVTNHPASGWMSLQVDGSPVDENYFFFE